jgi:hypothetical protein
MQSGIRTYLLADATLAAAVSSRVYAFPVPQAQAMPYLVLSRISGTIENTIGETLNVDNEEWQVDVVASTAKSAEVIKRYVVARLNIADRVEMGSYSAYSSSLTGVTDTTDLETSGGQGAIARTSLTFNILHNVEKTTP